MGNVRQLQSMYGFASTGGVATKLSMEAGLDQNMGGEFVTNTKALVLSGALANATLDRAGLATGKASEGLIPGVGPLVRGNVALVGEPPWATWSTCEKPVWVRSCSCGRTA